MDEPILTGGCQCGAIRFRMRGLPADRSICHCRMCQKAFGNYFAPLVNTRGTDFSFTRGRRRLFASSNHVMRGFCGNCGTPLTYEAEDGLAVAIGAFDDPSLLPPVVQYGIEARIDHVDTLAGLPGHVTEDDIASAPFLADIENRQHPDHDTDDWTVTPSDLAGEAR